MQARKDFRSSPTMGMQRLLRHVGFVPFPDSCDATSQRVHAKADARCGELGTRAFPVTEAVRRLCQVCERLSVKLRCNRKGPGNLVEDSLGAECHGAQTPAADGLTSLQVVAMGTAPMPPQRCAVHDGGTAAFAGGNCWPPRGALRKCRPVSGASHGKVVGVSTRSPMQK